MRGTHSDFLVPAPVVTLPGFVAQQTANDAVWNSVLTHAGARPADRDPVDARIVDGVRTKTGTMVNCVGPNGTQDCEDNAGGWPVYAHNTRPLELPDDPNGIAASGYTNLEEWLHAYARDVEGP